MTMHDDTIAAIDLKRTEPGLGEFLPGLSLKQKMLLMEAGATFKV
jgi:hypothetical protein